MFCVRRMDGVVSRADLCGRKVANGRGHAARGRAWVRTGRNIACREMIGSKLGGKSSLGMAMVWDDV